MIISKLVGIEIYKMIRRPRTYLGLAAFLVIDIMLLLGLRYGGLERLVMDNVGGQSLMVSGSPVNAVFFAWLVVASFFSIGIITFWIPFFSALVSGEILAGEYADGSLRMLLARPVNRMSLLLAKLLASIIYCFVLVFFLGIVAYILGWIWFGRGGLTAMGSITSPMLVWFPETEGLFRLLQAYLLTGVYATTIASVAFFISVWLNNPIGAIGGTMMLTFMMAILGEIPYFEVVHPYLYTSYVMLAQNMFVDPVPTGEVSKSLVVLGSYIAVFSVLSFVIFKKKDVLA